MARAGPCRGVLAATTASTHGTTLAGVATATIAGGAGAESSPTFLASSGEDTCEASMQHGIAEDAGAVGADSGVACPQHP